MVIKKSWGRLIENQQHLVITLEIIKLENYLLTYWYFVANHRLIVWQLPEPLLPKQFTTWEPRANCWIDLRVIFACDAFARWEHQYNITSESTFSHAFAEFSQNQLPELTHESLTKVHLGDRTIGHRHQSTQGQHTEESVAKQGLTTTVHSHKRSSNDSLQQTEHSIAGEWPFKR